MHLAERMRLPKPFTARPYRGAIDHPAMCAVLASHRAHGDGTETPTVEQLDAMYANLTICDLDRDLVIVESGNEPTAYIRGPASAGLAKLPPTRSAVRSTVMTCMSPITIFSPRATGPARTRVRSIIRR